MNSPIGFLFSKNSITSLMFLPICSSNFFVNSFDICIFLEPPQNFFSSFRSLLSLCGDSNIIVVFTFLLISKSVFSRSIFFFGRKPSKMNFEEGRPLETRAVIAAQAPGMQITS